MSRKTDLRAMAAHVGNSAAHVGIWGEDKVSGEIGTYMGIARGLVEERTWNEREVGEFAERATRRAARVIRERIKRGDLGEKEFDGALKRAQGYIDEFVAGELRK